MYVYIYIYIHGGDYQEIHDCQFWLVDDAKLMVNLMINDG